MDAKETLTVSVEGWEAGDEPDSEELLIVSGEEIETSWLTEDCLLWVTVGEKKFLARADRLFADDRSRVTSTLELHLHALREEEPLTDLWEWLQANSHQPVRLEDLTQDEVNRLASEPRGKTVVERTSVSSREKSEGQSETSDESEDNDLSLGDA